MEEDKVYERLKENKKNLAIGHCSAFYSLPAKHLEQYVYVLKHVKDIAKWDEIEHVAYRKGKPWGYGILTLDSENIEDNLKKLKEIHQDGIVIFKFSLIKDLRNLEEIEDFLKSVYLLSDDKPEWSGYLETSLYFKDGTMLEIDHGINSDDFFLALEVYVAYKDTKINRKEIVLSDELLKKALEEEVFSEYLYRILKTTKDIEKAIKDIKRNHKGFRGASIKVSAGNDDVRIANVYIVYPANITYRVGEKLIENVNAILKESGISFRDLEIIKLQKETAGYIHQMML